MVNSSANIRASFAIVEAKGKLTDAGRVSADLGLVPSQHARANRVLLGQMSSDFNPYDSNIK